MSVTGLNEIFAELYAENRRPSYDTADEIIDRLEVKGNFIPDSISARREYSVALLQEYGKYIEEKCMR